MSVFDKLTQERRARLMAERMLEQRGREMDEAARVIEALRRDIADLRAQDRQTSAERARQMDEDAAAASRVLADIDLAQRSASMAERRLWDCINTLHDAFAVFDSERRLVVANQAFLNAYAGLDEVKPGVTLRRILELLAYEERVDIEGRAPEDWIEFMISRWDSERYDPVVLTFWNGTKARVHERRARGGDIVSLIIDITQTERHATELEEARIRAEAASRAKSAFLANMSHEIRTPMNGVVGMAELLCDTPLSDEQRLYADTIRSSGEALLNIINDVLDYSKIEAQKLTLHPEPCDLEHAIHEIVLLLQAGARGRSIDLLLDYDLFLPTRFLADPGRLRQVLTNLIGNAVKFTRQGHVLIRVVGVETGEGQVDLVVTIEDTGIGIPSEKLDHIFSEFAQAEDQASRRFEGTGLGLSISKRLIELMGGTIWVESELGQGSCFGFRISLPVAEDMTALPATPPEVRRILVVDDNLVNRTILDRQLGTRGFTVEQAESGRAALEHVDQAGPNAFDLIITDHEMPGMDGLSLTRALRARGFGGRIILLSSSPAIAQGDATMPELAAILQKPLLRQDLMRHVMGMTLGDPVRPASCEPEPSERDEASAVLAARKRWLRILAAEDNRTNRLVFLKMVEGLPIVLHFAENGAEAVRTFEAHGADLVFMDISMPEMDGREASRQIRALPGGTDVPIIALTAHAMDSDRDDLLAEGMNDVLTKPLNKAMLVDIIRRTAAEAPDVETADQGSDTELGGDPVGGPLDDVTGPTVGTAAKAKPTAANRPADGPGLAQA